MPKATAVFDADVSRLATALTRINQRMLALQERVAEFAGAWVAILRKGKSICSCELPSDEAGTRIRDAMAPRRRGLAMAMRTDRPHFSPPLSSRLRSLQNFRRGGFSSEKRNADSPDVRGHGWIGLLAVNNQAEAIRKQQVIQRVIDPAQHAPIERVA